MSPFAWAVAYGLIASALAAGVSLFEGILFNERTVTVGGHLLVQHPYVENFSTILDFAVFNPIAIYFLLKVRGGFATAYSHFKARHNISWFDRIGLAVVSVAIGVSAMWFYFRGFVGSTFFTEAFEPTQSGAAGISFTGWSIFAATAVFISLVTFVTIEFGNYIIFIRQLKSNDLRFCLPPTLSADVEIAVSPCVNTAYVLATLFVVLAIFVFRDLFQFDIRQSWRVWLFAPYVLVCFVAFLPFWHLHNVMTKQRKEIISENNSVIEKEIWTSSGGTGEHQHRIDPKKLIVSMDRIESLQSFYRAIPIWPTSANALVVPNISLVISVGTLAYKIFDTLKGTIR